MGMRRHALCRQWPASDGIVALLHDSGRTAAAVYSVALKLDAKLGKMPPLRPLREDRRLHAVLWLNSRSGAVLVAAESEGA